jgi:hypothetical protein
MPVVSPTNDADALHAMAGRLAAANQLLAVIAKHGRHFFFSASVPRLASFLFDARMRLHFVDDYTGKAILLPPAGESHDLDGFSHGGTMRSLVEHLRDHILLGQLLNRELIAPANGLRDLWGYGAEAAEAVRHEAWQLPLFGPSAP